MYPHLLAGKTVKTLVPFVDADGTALTTPLLSASYSVLDENEVEVHSGVLTVGELALSDYTVEVSGAINTLTADAVRGLRTVVLTMEDTSGTHVISELYYIELNQTLRAGFNSMMTYSQALMLVPDIPLLEGWDAALADSDRRAALVEAYERLGRFRLNANYEESTIALYNTTSISTLDSRILSDFRKAQIIEANALLGGEPHHERRLAGVMSESAGESTTFYRTGMALSRGISSRAYAYIVRYLDNTVIARRT